MAQLAGCYAHLRGLPVKSYAGALPCALIDVDNCNITRALKSVDGKCDEPVASKTRLGWVVYGPCSVASAATGILRFGGRLTACSGINESSRNPIILPRQDYVTDLIIWEYHERYKHAIHYTVLSELRTQYLISKLLGEYRRVRKSCQRCRVHNAMPEPPLMGNLPQQRVAFAQRAFSFTGIDYFGPFLVSVGRRVEKRWGVLLTCLTSRAIHVEIAASLTTASCILAIRRFIARRGMPLEIFSDRGTNFVGASRELKEALEEVDHDALMTEFCCPRMKWTFNPPGAPHFGGFWERMVRSVKKVLHQCVFPKRPTDEVLLSTFTEIELVVNSRPLTYVPLEDETAEPLTPNHLLLGSSDGSKPLAVYCDSPAALRSSRSAAQQAADLFWKKWVSEYLPTLTHRTKWFEPVRPIEIGNLVVIADNNLPMNCWPRGRIVSVVPGKDGQVRQATIETTSGTYVTPAHKIAVLDVTAL
ncbi:uncharacterized protein LOC126567302 [Anopheles maculipalpis]|uniref:uncharacterized protein LOC126567302 n=1 Tax=Anopheles maculipalpis TaxID=1496333 RepID=UPI0021592C9F|nr:uncharacterized protein LOC126567302 [Anopheles maculipalpis]